MDERDSFIFYRSFYEAIQKCPNDVRLELYDAIAQYSLNIGYEPKFSGIAEALWILIKPQLDANIKRYLNGKKGADGGAKGGAPKGNNNAAKGDKQEQPKTSKTTPKQPQNNPKITANNNYNLNENNNKNNNLNTRSNTNVLSRVNNTHARTQENTLQTCGDFARDLLQDDIFTERVAMQFHTTPEDVLIFVNTFNNEQSIKQTAHADYNDYRRHAYDWIRIQIEKQEKERKHGNPNDNIQQAQERQLARLNKIAARDREVFEPLSNPF